MPTPLRRARSVLLALAILLVGSYAVANGPKVGDTPPEIKAAGFLNASGGAPSLASLKGKVVVLVFWGTWSPPCRKTMPYLAELQERNAEKGLVILGLTDEGKDVVEPFVKKLNLKYAIGFGSSSVSDYGIGGGRPVAFVIGADGKNHWRGFPSPVEPAFEAAIDGALAAKGK